MLGEKKLGDIKAKIEEDPTISMRKLAKVMEVSHTTALTATRNLGMTCYVRRKRQLLSSSTKLLKVKKGKKLVNWMRKNPGLVRVFSDEKFWTVDMARNARNDSYLATSASMVPPINATKHPQGAMMLGVVASDGKSVPPIWFPAGLKVGTNEYLDVLKTVVKPWLDSTYPEGNYVFQQDSAPGHKAIKTQKWCSDNLTNFWPWGMWPPSSPDCSPLDYGI
ncbi:Uncharacterized protein FKW44_014746 [Caligus rogercresseyi]|uniref:Uncharacterized protein n=1 Tax=Caligus rogercresseyi TaxID=217165 RepID=A0A7T8GZC9_CALRO|nr:Uncharacterized protein FKW44_014746 [Caligus rogercresseyi]